MRRVLSLPLSLFLALTVACANPGFAQRPAPAPSGPYVNCVEVPVPNAASYENCAALQGKQFIKATWNIFLLRSGSPLHTGTGTDIDVVSVDEPLLIVAQIDENHGALIILKWTGKKYETRKYSLESLKELGELTPDTKKRYLETVQPAALPNSKT